MSGCSKTTKMTHSEIITNGTAVGSPAFVTDTPTGTGKAINFNGSGDRYVKVDDGQNQTVFNGDKKFTISTWVKEQPDGGWEPWISKRGEGGRGWQLRREGGGVVMFTTNGPSGGDGNMRNGMVWDNAKWYHLAAVHGAGDGSKQRLYVDGELLVEQQRTGSQFGIIICLFLVPVITTIALDGLPKLILMMTLLQSGIECR